MLELKKYRTIPLDGDLTKDEILQAVEKIKLLNNVDVVYAQPSPQLGYVDSSKLPQDNVISTPSVGYLGNFLPYQGYLNPAPQGIDAKYAWTIRGGHGKSIKVVDVEGAWNRSHDDLPSMFTSMGGDYNSVEWFNHGTAVEGIVSGVDNGFGIQGNVVVSVESI